MKKALLALALVVSATGASYAQTAGQSVMGFLLAQGSTYNGYTCPSSQVYPCFVQYGSRVPTVPDSADQPISIDQTTPGTTNGVVINPTSASGSAVAPSVSAVNATSLIVKASAGNYYDAYCYASVAGNCIVYNSATVPSAGALTSGLVLECLPANVGTINSVAYNPGPPSRASAGIVVLFSSAAGETNCNTYTASSTAYIHARAQ